MRQNEIKGAFSQDNCYTGKKVDNKSCYKELWPTRNKANKWSYGVTASTSHCLCENVGSIPPSSVIQWEGSMEKSPTIEVIFERDFVERMLKDPDKCKDAVYQQLIITLTTHLEENQ